MRGARPLIVICVLVTAGQATASSGCGRQTPPVLRGIAPAIGYPRQLLAVDGDTLWASVVWDAGGPNEQVLVNGLFGTTYFQVPDGAAAGSHPVAIRTAAGTSGIVHVEVLKAPANPFPAPRIEDVAIASLGGSGPVDVALTVSAANLDVDATVAVREIVQGGPVEKPVALTVRWGAIPVDYQQHHDPDTFGYPIFHYTQLLSVVEGVTLGSTLEVVVTNRGGRADSKTYVMPAAVNALDSDGDALLDSWETGSYTAPGSGAAVPLAAMGTRPLRKDVLVEVDWIGDAEPLPDTWQAIEQVFSEAPVLNPDGSRGVNVIIDRGQGGPFGNGGQVLADHDCIILGPPPAGNDPGCPTLKNFFEYKAAMFDPARLLIFHYAVFGRAAADGSTGSGERYGNDFFVTLLESGLPLNIAAVQAGIFTHELGHNLAFSHEGPFTSGTPEFVVKPNVLSVVNYLYTAFGAPRDCDPFGADRVYTYSDGALATLHEPAVDEGKGICDEQQADLNLNGAIDPVGPLDLNHDGDTIDIWEDFNQWGALRFDFTAGPNWNGN